MFVFSVYIEKPTPLSLHIYNSRAPAGRGVTRTQTGGGGRGDGERAGGRHPQGAVSKDRVPGPALRARTLGCPLPTQTATRNEILHSWGGEGERGAGGKLGCGDPLLVPALPTEPPGGGGGRGGPCRPPQGFLVRKTEGPGGGAGHPPTPRFPGTWAVSVGHTQAPPEEPGRTWGSFLGLLVGTRGPQSTSRARPWGQGRPQEQGRGDPFQGRWPVAEAWGAHRCWPGVSAQPPHTHTIGPAQRLRKGPEPRGLRAGLPPPGRGRPAGIRNDWNIQELKSKHRCLIQHLKTFVHFCFVETEVRYTCLWPHGGGGGGLAVLPLQEPPPEGPPNTFCPGDGVT